MQVAELPTNQLAGAIALAVLAAVVKFALDGWASRRANRLRRIDRQLELFYGPLLALSHASEEAWTAFRAIYRPGKESYWGDPSDQPTDAEARAWRLWMEHVFMPLNERLEKVIVEHPELLEEEYVPQVLLDVCAHVETYKGVIEQWKVEDLSRQKAVIRFPSQLKPYAQSHYTALKQRQAALISAGA